MQTITFYFATLAIFFAFGGSILLILWQHIKQQSAVHAKAYLFLFLALFTLSLSSVHFFVSSHEDEAIKILVERILSAVSNMFLVLSLPFFSTYSSNKTNKYISEYTPMMVVLFFSGLFVLFSLLFEWKIGRLALGKTIVISLETAITALVLLVFGYRLSQVFNQQTFAAAFRYLVYTVFFVLVGSQIVIAINQLLYLPLLANNVPYIVFPIFVGFLCFTALIMVAGISTFLMHQTQLVQQQHEQEALQYRHQQQEQQTLLQQQAHTIKQLQEQLEQTSPITPTLSPIHHAESIMPLSHSTSDFMVSDNENYLTIGYEQQLYFFQLHLPKCGIRTFRYENYKLVNGFLFLLFYAVAQKQKKYHQKTTLNGYSIAMFNNTLIQAINTQLIDAGFEKIVKEDLLVRTRQGRFELTIDSQNIAIVGIESIQKDSDRNSIESILSMLDTDL
jgi:hypothetical protein